MCRSDDHGKRIIVIAVLVVIWHDYYHQNWGKTIVFFCQCDDDDDSGAGHFTGTKIIEKMRRITQTKMRL
jgi:hypothetical protein